MHCSSLTLIGKRDVQQSEIITEQTFIMDPVAPDFNSGNATIMSSANNITLRSLKPEKAIQDTFHVSYVQLDPLKYFPNLNVHDITDQRFIEIYLGNLKPGRDYNVSITSLIAGIESKPWTGLLTTKPLPPENLTVTEVNINGASCVKITWNASRKSGVDHFAISYGPQDVDAPTNKITVQSSQTNVDLCTHLHSGLTYKFSIVAYRHNQRSQSTVLYYTLRPKAPQNLGILVDFDKRKFRCSFLIDLHPGRRYEISAVTISGGVKSKKASNNFALPPAFDMRLFGLNLREENGDVKLEWPEDEMRRRRLNDIWRNLVGNDSSLHMRVDPLSASAISEQSKQFESKPSDDEPIVIRNLRKGSCYKIQIYTVTKSGIVSSERFEELFRMSAPAVNVTREEILKTSAVFRVHLYDGVNVDRDECSLNIMVMCGKPSMSKQRSCAVKVRSMEQITFETKQDRPGPVQNLTVQALNPYSVKLSWFPPVLANGLITQYTVEVYAMDGGVESIDWWLNVNADGLSKQDNDHRIDVVVDSLIGGLQYRFDVRAVTEAGQGDSTAASHIRMPLLAPPRPNVRVEVLRNTIHSNDVAVRYSTAMFSTKHGLLSKHALIVCEVANDGRLNENWIVEDGNRSVRTWAQVQRFDVWPPYVALESPIEPANKFVPTKFISEMIGVDKRCKNMPIETVCNGPLKAATKYRFKLRIYTSSNLWTDSDFSEIVITESAHSVTAVGGILIALLLLFIPSLFIAVIIFAWNKHKKLCGATYGSAVSSKESQWAALKMMMAERAADCLAKLGLDSEHDASSCANETTANASASFGHHRRSRSLRERTGVDQRLERLPSGPPPNQKSFLSTIVPGANTNKSRPVRVCDFVEHVRLMSADSDFRFSEEYDDLKSVGNGQTCIAADLTVNRAKNRFTNVLPYDHSRVKLLSLDDEDGSDYVNASYIPGFNSRREFIAAQGPLPSTRDHFWRLVWEQQCPAIVALTKCVEKGRDKCHQYWPDNDQLSVVHADIEVTLMNETVYDEFILREVRLTNLSQSSSLSRTVRHFHYMAWPDFGVPERASGIVQFVRLFRQKLPPSTCNKPTIVHCSAGVGRSGTFIALDHLMQSIAHDRPLDVFGIVYDMRMERCHMVQNEVRTCILLLQQFYIIDPMKLKPNFHLQQQYIFIHQCLEYVLQNDATNTVKSSPSVPSPNVNAAAIFRSTNSSSSTNNSNNSSANANNNKIPNRRSVSSGHSSISTTNMTINYVKIVEEEEVPAASILTRKPRIEVHKNAAFEDDEGIAESGL
ncbi:unnamed protein product [Anisakis simplex]|uniref:protein-tyrosine-phosphatase n=1 Tax=Anisakis simplex TaxID=6269 RepID=A0A0M3JX74_ANISI|nr:unnamed protein product [Anisakis simplex]